ncbi:MAG: cell division protein FtsA [Candidatus Levyibacteriota bacterium]
MRDSQIVVGVDIGSSKIATLIGKLEEDVINVLGVSELPAKGIRKGQIVDIEEAASAINASLDAAERMAGYSISKVFISISGVHIESQNSKGIVAISEPQGEISDTDVARVLEAAGAISLPSTATIIHVLPKTFTVDGEGGIKDPNGMTGVRLEVDTHIITANTTSVRNIERVFEQEAGVGINALVFSGLASSLATLTETEKELGVIVADIGAGITNICIFTDGALSYSAVIPIGARHITNDLAIGLRISLESAEKIKLYLSGKATKKGTVEGEEDEVDLSELHLPEELKKVSKKTLVEGIIRPRLNELFTMIGQELKKSGFATQTPSGLVITGGGARTIGAPEAAKRMLSMPVRIGLPTSLSGLIDDVENPSFSTAVGLLNYGRNFTVKETGGMLDSLFSAIPSGGSTKGMVGKLKKMVKNFIP